MPTSLSDSANALLDATYKKATGTMLKNISSLTRDARSQVQRSLRELEDEAKRLAEDDKRLTADNAVLQKALRDYQDALNSTQSLILANDNAVQASGQLVAPKQVTAKVFSQISSKIIEAGINPLSDKAMRIYLAELRRLGVNWNLLTAKDFVTGYIDTAAWAAKMEKWGEGYSDLTHKTILQGINEGWGPSYAAGQLRQHAENIPLWAADNLMRTLQLTSYRDASVAMERANSDFIVKKVRIAALDSRTCLSCIELHGTELQPGERVDDHYRGRCSEFYVLPGGAERPSFMQADSQPGKRNFIPFQNGRDWFASLPPERQRQQASFAKSPAKWNAFKAGKITLADLVGDHVDPVFGNQKIERALIAALGKEAEKYYARNQ